MTGTELAWTRSAWRVVQATLSFTLDNADYQFDAGDAIFTMPGGVDLDAEYWLAGWKPQVILARNGSRRGSWHDFFLAAAHDWRTMQ